MSWAWWCVLAMAVMPIVAAGYAKAGGGYDNDWPRDFQPRDPARRRAWAAQANCFEALPLFLAAVTVATLYRVPQATADGLAIAVVVARCAYLAAYISGRSLIRSGVWTVGFVLTVALFTAPVWPI